MLRTLRKYGESRKMEPTLQQIMIDGIESIFNRTSLQSTAYSTLYKELMTEQNEIGWHQFFKRRVSN